MVGDDPLKSIAAQNVQEKAGSHLGRDRLQTSEEAVKFTITVLLLKRLHPQKKKETANSLC